MILSKVRLANGSRIGEWPARWSPEDKRPLVIGRDALIRSGSVIYLGSTIGKKFETGHNVVVREDNQIGDDVKVWSNSVVDYDCFINNNVKIHCGCYVAQFTHILDNVFLGPNVTITNCKRPTGDSSKDVMEPVRILNGAKVGANCTILAGVEIGRGALVGAGSVVTKSLPDNCVAYGNPAKVFGT